MHRARHFLRAPTSVRRSPSAVFHPLFSVLCLLSSVLGSTARATTFDFSTATDVDIGAAIQAGAFIVDPVLTGIDPKNQTQSAFISPASYKQRAHQNVHLARIGSATKWENVEKMIAQTATSGRGSRDLPAPDRSEDYLARYRGRTAMIKLIHDTMDRYSRDAIALPYRTIPPKPYPGPRPPESSTNLTLCTGLSAIVVPGGYIPDGRPIGIQILGREHSEPPLLQVAYRYEQATEHRKIPALTPPLPGESFTY